MLLRLDMIREAARLPEVEYAFRNPLTQEAVYKTILLKRRRDFHGRVGAAMEALYPEQLDTLYGLLAHHFTLAGQAEKAIGYARQAARQAVGLYAYGDPLQNLNSALALVPAGEARETHLLVGEQPGDVCRLMRDGAGAIPQYQEALAAGARWPPSWMAAADCASTCGWPSSASTSAAAPSPTMCASGWRRCAGWGRRLCTWASMSPRCCLSRKRRRWRSKARPWTSK